MNETSTYKKEVTKVNRFVGVAVAGALLVHVGLGAADYARQKKEFETYINQQPISVIENFRKENDLDYCRSYIPSITAECFSRDGESLQPKELLDMVKQ